MKNNQLPELVYNDWKDTIATVHLWTQIIGKIKLRAMPWINQSWHVTLQLTPKGLSTGSMPYEDGIFEIAFDFLQHVLTITTSDGDVQELKLHERTVADFYAAVFDTLKKMGIEITIYTTPNEIENAIPFEKDEVHKSYDKQQMQNFWKVLIWVHNIFLKFRAGFEGKCSPVHFFWGSFDLAVTRFSGRPAPLYEGNVPNIPLKVMQEAYSQEVSSCGFWAGSEAFPQAAFYAYAYPEPATFKDQVIEPAEAVYNKDMGEFILLYDAVKNAANPEAALLKFLNTTYEAAAITANWDRKELECYFSSFERR